MWTPKRIILLATGFILFVSAYFVYSQFLGGIDGLPALPADYQITQSEEEIILPSARRENSAEVKLQQAFGIDCEEKGRNIQLEIDSKRMVLAAGEMAIDDGRVKLWPFSLAIFGKEKGDNQFPEINTLKSDVAFLTFDEKVKSIVDMNGRRIIAAELQGDIYVVNNRRTPEPDDDLSLFTQGPLFYDESQHLIFTKNDTPVRIIDPATKPDQNTIAGIGLYIYLKANEKSSVAVAGADSKAKGGMTTDVERIVLGRDVDMTLWVDAHSGFLGSGSPGAASTKTGAKPKASAPAPVQAEKAKVVMMTQGPFSYDLRSNVATFDVSKIAGARPNVVTVDRLNEREGKQDHLQCDHLEILFHRKNDAPKPTGGSAQADGLDIENARATGKEVVLTSDAEYLEAHGNDFFYDKLKQVSILKGAPHMWALKEGNEIEAPALEMHQQKGAEEAIAIGAGHIRMLDKKTGKRPIEARWTERLNYQKDGQQDILTLRGDATFIDDEHKQQLAADILKVWLLPADPAAAKEVVPSKDGEQPQRKPRKLDAQGHVSATGPDMNLHNADHFVVHFKDVPLSEGQLPPLQPAPPGPAKAESGQPLVGTGKPNAPAQLNKPDVPAETPSSKKPIDLAARTVTAFVRRIGERSEIDELWCEGTVRVQQAPATPEDRGIDIRGETLKLNHHVDGNVLVVTGEHAQVQINKICILGPEVNIDQTSNEVWVTGMGIMRMLSKSNFDGKELEKPTELIVSWDNRMYFDGQSAKFRGNVHGEQDTGHLAAPWMDVTLDHKISLKEGEKSGPPAKVQKLVCGDRQVWMEDMKQEGKRVVAAKRIDCLLMSVDNDPVDQETQMEATGPGVVRLFQQGGQDELASGAPAQKTPAKTVSKAKGKDQAKSEEQTKLTRVTFEGKMVGNNKRGTATFYDKVTMLNFPTDNPDHKITEGRWPPGYMYLTCEQLEVMSRKLNDKENTTVKEMRAYRNVHIEGPEFSGHADVVKYDESKEQIILEGSEGSPAVLYRESVKGANPDKTLRGRQIIYWRLTGLSSVDGARELHISK